MTRLGAWLAGTPPVLRGQPLRLTTVEQIGTVVVLALLGVAVILIGRYGWRKGGDLLPRTAEGGEAAHRAAVLRRGAVACAAAGLLVLAGAIAVAAE
jgi:hypothetical protein